MVINDVKKLFDNTDHEQKELGWYEFDLAEVGLPSAEEILSGVEKIKDKVGLQGWRTKNFTSERYKGFGITHNPTFFDKDENIYHQVWGSNLCDQYFGKKDGTGDHTQIKDTYYDTFGFRKIDNVISDNLSSLLNKFNFHISRSRVAYLYGYGQEPNNEGWHVDEPSCQLLRVNIPIQTGNEYVIQWDNKTYHLEVGKAYIWNTRKPHRPAYIKKVETKEPRINVVLGLTPWLNYDEKNDKYSKNKYLGKPIKEIVEEKLWLKE